MQQIRNNIIKIDKEIISLLGKRMKLALKIGGFKKKNGLPIQDKDREAKLIDIYKKSAVKSGLDETFIDKLFRNIFRESRKIQRNKKI